MKQNLQEVYTWTLEKYKKYKSRFDKNVASGRFESFSQKKQGLIIERISKLKKRLKELKLQLKLGVAAATFSIALSTTSVSAQQLGPFIENEFDNPIRSVSIAGQHQAVAFADMDADGDQDALIGDITGQLKYYEYTGYSTNAFFQERVDAAVNPFNGISVLSSSTPILVDFDNDGDADLILGQYDGYNITGVTYYENDDFDDDGTIGNSPTFVEINSPGSPIDGVFTSKYNIKPELVDIDNDGDLDVFIGQDDDDFPYDGALLFFENNSGFSRGPLPPGLGEFESGSFSGLSFTSPTFEDIDLDGDQDLFIGTFGGTIRFFENLDDSDGTIGNNPNFTERIGTLNPFDGEDVGTVAKLTFVDLDADGDRDLVVGNGDADDPPNYFENTPSGFTELTRLKNPFGAFDVTYDASPTFVDIDADGDLDAVIGTKYRDDLSFLENNNGQFTDLTETGTPFDNLTPDPDAASSPAFAQLDSDSDFDLVIGFYYDPAARLLRNTGTPESPAFNNEGDPFAISVVTDSDSSPTLGDITGDGVIDAVVGFGNQGSMRFFEGTSNAPTFTERSGTQNPLDGFNLGTVGQSRYAKPDLVDLDFDGDLDLVVGLHGYGSEIYDGALFYLENNGTGNFTELNGTSNPLDGIRAAPTGSETGASEPSFADIDLDGDLDLFLGNADGRIQYFENQNQPPNVNSNNSLITFTEGDSPILLDDVISIFDDGNDDILSIDVVITSNFQPGLDILDVDVGVSGITSSFDNQSGTLSLVGLASLADYQDVLRTITYENIGDDPQGLKTVTFIPVDFDHTDPLSDSNPETTIDINVIPINDPPEVVVSGNNVTFVEAGLAVPLDPGLLVTDSDNTELVGATITINQNFASGQDWLDFTDQNGISGNYDLFTGILRLTGIASISNYETALRSVQFRNTSSNPSDLQRTVDFLVNDGSAFSTLQTVTVNVVPVNTMPFLSSDGQGTIEYIQNASPIILDPDLSTFDNDDVELESLTVSINGYISGDLLDAEMPSGVTKNFDSQTGVLTLNGTALVEDYSSALRTVSFSSTNGSGDRVIQFVVNDGELNSDPFEVALNILGTSEQLTIYNAVSPNGDGLNDWWIIEGLTSPNNIKIFNRWGDEVKELNDYAGRADLPNNELDDLIAGTYFYQIESPEGSFEGYLTIKK